MDSVDSPQQVRPTAMLTRFGLFASVGACGAGIDLATKNAVFHRLGAPDGYGLPAHLVSDHPIYWIWPNFFAFETSLNQGALFGAGQGWVWLFALLSLVALGGIVLWLFVQKSIAWRVTAVLGLVSGGIVGNLYDRLGLWNDVGFCAVRDWIRISYYSHVWPNFNIADSLLVVGAFLLMWQTAKSDR